VKGFGNPAHTKIPLAGDYDNDGKTDLGIYDQTASQFLVLLSGGGALTPSLGTASHQNVPIPSPYAPGGAGGRSAQVGRMAQQALPFETILVVFDPTPDIAPGSRRTRRLSL
jgi:hypothetical protein